MYFHSYLLPVDTFNGQFLLDPVFFFIVNNINTVKFFTQAHLDFIVEFLLPRSYPGFFRGVESWMERSK